MVGNRPNFNSFDVFRCFLLIDERIGRAEISKKLELGEGTVKSILNILKNKKLIVPTNKGHVLSNKGSNVLKNINEIMDMPKELVSKKIYPENKKTGIVVKKYNKNLKIYILRDTAVKNGADGALIFNYEKTLTLPESESEDDFSELEDVFDVRKNNILILSFAEDSRTTENSALAVAFEMNKSLRTLI